LLPRVICRKSHRQIYVHLFKCKIIKYPRKYLFICLTKLLLHINPSSITYELSICMFCMFEYVLYRYLIDEWYSSPHCKVNQFRFICNKSYRQIDITWKIIGNLTYISTTFTINISINMENVVLHVCYRKIDFQVSHGRTTKL